MGKLPFRAVTIKDIGNRLGMSHSTVSRALNGHEKISADTKARVHAAAVELGYIPSMPARAIRGDATLTFGLAIPEIRDDLYGRIAKEFADRCRESNCRMMLVLTNDDPEQEYSEIRALAEARVSGMAVTLTGSPKRTTLDLLEHTPTIQMVRRLDGLAHTAVCFEEREGCASAVEQLASAGHMHIGYIGNNARVSSAQDRIKGYLAAHAKAGIVPLRGGMELGPLEQRFGYEGVKRLLSLPVKPTAIVIATSHILVGALLALRDSKVRIPRDLSVVSYGNGEWNALTNPPLTSVSLPVEDMVRAALPRLFLLARGEALEKSDLFIKPFVKLRESIAPPAS